MTGDAAPNRANWQVWAAAHGQDAYYDSAGLVGGTDSLTDVERAGLAAAVGSVDGLDVLHVQCHLGFDAISLARRGARVSGQWLPLLYTLVACRFLASLSSDDALSSRCAGCPSCIAYMVSSHRHDICLLTCRASSGRGTRLWVDIESIRRCRA